MVGSAEVLQHTPLTEMATPPLSVKTPPLLAVLAIVGKVFGSVVMSAGIEAGSVVKVESAPYTVPANVVA